MTVNCLVALVCSIQSHGLPDHTTVGNTISLNLMIAILARQENSINLAYEVAVSVPKSTPLSVRCRLAQVFHYGGVHSGCGMSALFWVILQAAISPQVGWTGHLTSITQRTADVLSWIMVPVLVVVTASAMPNIRRRWYNSFELCHRFAGWLMLLLFWVHAIVSGVASASLAELTRSPSIWCLSISTACGVLSWSRLRRRRVTPEPLSSHAIRLHFHYRQMPPFYGIKVSDRPLLEWHSFATIPDEGGGFSILVSNAGDWTRKTITRPPPSLWVRGAPIHGVSFAATLFRRVVVVATGSGIGPILSLLVSRTTPCHVLWSARKPNETYGCSIVDAVRTADPNAHIWDTNQKGRPDLVRMAADMVSHFGAEAVFVLSNRIVTEAVVQGLKRHTHVWGAV